MMIEIAHFLSHFSLSFSWCLLGMYQTSLWIDSLTIIPDNLYRITTNLSNDVCSIGRNWFGCWHHEKGICDDCRRGMICRARPTISRGWLRHSERIMHAPLFP